jgi:cohesin complex subunit SCC1
MFFTEAILSRRGPLAKVWLAAHMERKLSKTQTLQTDIEESVEAIKGKEVEILALRLSGQLLLGVVRIYSRKAKYLLDDCNEALMKIKMTFRPGIVDMTEDQLVNKNAITLQATGIDLDLFIPDINWELDFVERPAAKQKQHLARQADITLASAYDLDLNLNEPSDFDLGPADGIASQDFDLDFDLGITWEDNPQRSEDGRSSVHEDNDDTMSSVEMGLDAPAPRQSLDPGIFGQEGMDVDLLSVHSKSRAPSVHSFAGDPMDLGDGFSGGLDLTEFGVGFDDVPEPIEPVEPLDLPAEPAEGEKTPTREMSRLTSPLTELAPSPPPEGPAEAEAALVKPKRKVKEKKQIIDTNIELANGPGARRRGQNGLTGQDVSNLLKQPSIIPRSTIQSRFVEIRDDPLSHFLPTKSTADGSFMCFAPPGLPGPLANMFMYPTGGTAPKRRGTSPEKSPSKRRRTELEDEIEAARRADSAAPSLLNGSEIHGRAGSTDVLGDLTFGAENTIGGLDDDFQMQIPADDSHVIEPSIEQPPSERARSMSRLSSLGPEARYEEGEDSYADAACPIVEFDLKPTQTATQEQAGELAVPVPVEHDSKGYSKNTVKALSVIRSQLRPTDDENDEDKFMSFKKMADKASRRAAASFFFELLVLSTRDCIRVSQAAPFENIEVRAKDKLWEQQEPQLEAELASRIGSVAPSRSSSAAPSRHSSVAPSHHSSAAASVTPRKSVASTTPGPSRQSSAVPTPSRSRASVARSISSVMGL